MALPGLKCNDLPFLSTLQSLLRSRGAGWGRSSSGWHANADLEGIVAKRRFDAYLLDGSERWYKIRNRNYSQWVESEGLFKDEPDGNPDLPRNLLLGFRYLGHILHLSYRAIRVCNRVNSGQHLCRPFEVLKCSPVLASC
jgi:hypothetical protein